VATPLPGRLGAYLAGRQLSAQRLRPLRRDWQRVGMDHRLVPRLSSARPDQGVLYPEQSARAASGGQLRSGGAADANPAKGT